MPPPPLLYEYPDIQEFGKSYGFSKDMAAHTRRNCQVRGKAQVKGL